MRIAYSPTADSLRADASISAKVPILLKNSMMGPRQVDQAALFFEFSLERTFRPPTC